SQNRKSPLPGAKCAAIGKNYRRTVRLSDLPLPDGSRTSSSTRSSGVAMLPSFQFALMVRFDCSIKAFKLNSLATAGKVYPDEIDIQEAHPKHRKLDSQAAIPHPTRD